MAQMRVRRDATRWSKDAENPRLHVHVLQDVRRRRDVALALLERGQHAREFGPLGLAVHLPVGHVAERLEEFLPGGIVELYGSVFELL